YGIDVDFKPSRLQDILKANLLVQDKNEAYLEPFWSVLIKEGNNKFINSTVVSSYTKDYLARVYNHSDKMQKVKDAKTYKETIENDDDNLLGQLNLLIKNLKFNSVNGVGQETVAGSQGELALHHFIDYLTKVKDQVAHLNNTALNQELKLLRQMVGKYAPGEAQIPEIETCFATRAQKLQEVISALKKDLANISVSKQDKAQLVQEANEKYESAVKA
ncbi:hypothetical protein, partial [Facilibium subflavum]|uniref:hypothetical protein n=1 Tax=Facilibium subflavum TaxID=2219058 RepID=UPI001AACF028